MNKLNQGGSGKKTLDERRIASEKHDEQFFKDRKVTEAKNLELTLKLRAQRLAHEATLPKPDKPPPRAPRKKAPRKKAPRG